MSTAKPPVPLFIKMMYSLGQTGWNLANSCFMLLLIYFYHPPIIGNESVFTEFIERKVVFLSFTTVGLLMFIGTAVSAIVDILMGPISDKSKFKFGRRRTFLAISFLPISLCVLMSFFPLIDGKSSINIWWLAVGALGFNIFLSVYVTPFNGLIAELGHNQKDRVFISTLLAVTWGIGLIGANTIFALKGWVSDYFHISGTHAFQYLILLFCVISMVLMLLPVIFVNEDKYCIKTAPVKGNPFEQMKSILKITNFRRYMWVELFYWFSSQFIQLGIAYYVTTIVGLEEHFVTLVVIGAAACSFISFPLVMPLTEKYNQKTLLLIAFIMLALLFAFILLLGVVQLPIPIIALIIILLNTFPMAIFGILPMALVSDMATEDAQNTGQFRSATFFGVKFFVMKIGISLTNLLFPTLLLLGNSLENNQGVKMTALVGMIGTIISLLLMTKVYLPKLKE
ncbi:MAG: MFS transporter [Chitinophagales bacterium]|nr:MFS transporter [Chitinophagales bacterium]MCZ2394871.1 MFS transporter [Chitinophagales bacterium]